MSCPDNTSNFTDPIGCGNLPDVYECPDDGTYLYNIAKRLRWFARVELTGNCPANYVGDSVIGRGSYTSRISQSDANTHATAIANTAIAASLACQPLFWTGNATYVWQCDVNPAVMFSVTMTTPSWVSQEHANFKAYALAYETAKGMADSFCCSNAPYSYTATFTSTCTTGLSDPKASSIAVVTAMSCVSALEAQSIAENEAQRAAKLGMSCDYNTDALMKFLAGTQRCSEGNNAGYTQALTGFACWPDPSNPCGCIGAEINEDPPDPPGDIPCQQACWLRECGEVVGVTLFNCDQEPPAGATLLANKKVTIQICNTINGQIICENVNRIMTIWVLDIPAPNPPGCNPCGSGYGMESFLFLCGDNSNCNILGFYCCGQESAGFGFCRCYSPCCLGAAFCVDY